MFVGTDNNGTVSDRYIEVVTSDFGGPLLEIALIQIVTKGGNPCGGGSQVTDGGRIRHNALGYPAPDINSP